MGWTEVKNGANDVAVCSTLFLETVPSDAHKPADRQVFSEDRLNYRLGRYVENSNSKPSLFTGNTYRLFLYRKDDDQSPQIALSFDLSLKRHNTGADILERSFYHWHIHVGIKTNHTISRQQIYDQVKEKCQVFLAIIATYPTGHKLFVVGGKASGDVQQGAPVDNLFLDFDQDKTIRKGDKEEIDTSSGPDGRSYPYFRNIIPTLYRQEILEIP